MKMYVASPNDRAEADGTDFDLHGHEVEQPPWP